MGVFTLFVLIVCLVQTTYTTLSAGLEALNNTSAASVSFVNASSWVQNATAFDDDITAESLKAGSSDIINTGSEALQAVSDNTTNADPGALKTRGSDKFANESTISSISVTPKSDEAMEKLFSTMMFRCQTQALCHSDVWEFLKDGIACTPCLNQHCSCDNSDCPTRRVCCLEVLLYNKVDVHPRLRPGCYSSTLSLKADQSDLLELKPQTYYSMETTCPNSWTWDEEVVKKCTAFTTATADKNTEGGGRESVSDSQPLHDDDELVNAQWPVWSPVTNVTYRNVHCALCHRQDPANLRSWDISVNCLDWTKVNYGSGSLWNLIGEVKGKDNCFLAFNPPPGTSSKECKPPSSSEPACGSEAYVDPMFRRSCDSIFNNNNINNNNGDSVTSTTNSTKRQPPDFSVEINGTNVSVPRSNLLCALCVRAFRGQECSPPIDIDTPFPFVLVISFRALTSLRADPPHNSGSRATEKGQCSCAYDEVYDTYESRCRKLYCSPTRRLDQQRSCVPFVDRSQGLAYQLAFRLIPLSTNTTSRSPAGRTIISPSMAAYQIYYAFLFKTKLSGKAKFDEFYVLVRTKHVNEDRRDINVLAGKRNQQIRTRTAERLDVHVKLVVSTMVPSVKELEDRLIASLNSTWNLSLVIYGEMGSYQATTLYAGTKRNDFGKEDGKDAQEEANAWDAEANLVSSNDKYDLHFVDLSKELLKSYSSLHGFSGTENLIPRQYHVVQTSLTCSKVSFTLHTAVNNTRHLQGDESHAELAHTNEGVTGAWRKRTAEKKGEEGKKSRKQVAQSLNEVNGEAVVSLDLQTGWLHHHPSGRHVHFRYVDQVDAGEVHVCAEQLFGTSLVPDILWGVKKAEKPLVLEKHFSSVMIYMSVACQSLSTLCLFLAFFTYCVFSELRTLPGRNNMGLTGSLFVAMLLFEVGVARVEFPLGCMILGMAIHFSLLLGFTWMVLCSAHMHRVFTRFRASRQDQSDHEKNLFAKYVMVSLLVPAVIVVLTVLGNGVAHREDCVLDLGYGRGICYLSNGWSLILASIVPVCTAVVTNLILFVATLRSLRSLHSVSANILQASQQHKKQLAVYVRLSTLTGVNWLAGLLAAPVESLVVWYLFIVLCGLQGVYIFVAFICNKRVLTLYKNLLCCYPEKNNMQVSMTT